MIVFCHLLNDMSGSPRILRLAIDALSDPFSDNRLFVGSQGTGILSETDLPTQHFWYRRSRFRAITLGTYLISQIALFFQLARSKDIPPNAVIYVNTLLPFGAAIWGRVTGRDVVYHLHEVSLTPRLLMRCLTWIAARTADQLIYVSADHQNRLPIGDVPYSILPNPADQTLTKDATTSRATQRAKPFRILMLASPRPFKGVPEFLGLADALIGHKGLAFNLVLNADTTEIAAFRNAHQIPANVTIHPRTMTPATHYVQTDLVVNLSRPDLWVETFGLTLIEAMTFGLPVIAPPIGGPTELITHGREGFLIDCRDQAALIKAITRLSTEPNLYAQMSARAKSRAADFTFTQFSANLTQIVATADPQVLPA